jgi:hypothetical protein
MGTHQFSRSLRALIAITLLAAWPAHGDEPAPVEEASHADVAPAAMCPAEPVPMSPQTGEESEGAAIAIEDIEKKTGFNIIPIPEIILDPNEGNTYGVMGVMLFTDKNDEIKYMVAPDVRYNDTKGIFPIFRLFGYPSDTRRYSVALGKSTTRDETYDAEFAERGLLDNKAFLLGKVLYERDSTERFYGIGNHSDENEESNYTSQVFLLDLNPGYWVLDSVNLSYRMRVLMHGVQPGEVNSIPDITVEHPNVPGLDKAVYWQHRLAITYDTRDSRDMPTHGTYANAYVNGADQHVGSATSFVAYGFEAREFIPFRGERRNPILAMRALVDYLQGDSDTPFWLQNSLGGRRTLRGFGGDRFIDFNRSLLSAELRTRVYQHRLFGVNGELELAPFIEAGQVFSRTAESPLSDLHVVGGVGVRAVVRPQLVAFVDVGYGSEGNSVFTGIDYPF